MLPPEGPKTPEPHAGLNGTGVTLRAINEASGLIQEYARTQNLPDLLETIVHQAVRLLNSAYGGFYLTDAEKQTVTCAVSFQTSQSYVGAMLRYGEGVAGKIAQTGQALSIDDYRCWPGRANLFDSDPTIQAVLGVPVIWQGQVTGVLEVLDDTEKRRFNTEEMELLSLFAHQAAIAIENARLFSQADTERARLSLLYDIGRELSSSLNADHILNRAASLTCQALGGLTAAAFLYIPAENRLSLRALYGFNLDSLLPLDEWLDLRPGRGLAGWVAEKRQAMCVADVLQDEHWIQTPVVDDDGRAAISSPILFGDQLLGVLNVLHRQPGFFRQEHLPLLEALCQAVAVALSNARRYEEVQRRLAEITLIQDLTKTFNQRLEVQQLLEEVARQLVQRLGYRRASIYLTEEGRMVQKTAFGENPAHFDEHISRGIVDLVARSGQTAYLPQTIEPPAAAARQEFAEVNVPISVGKSVVGVISVLSEPKQNPEANPTDILLVLAGQVSVALENAVLYDTLRKQTRDLESTVARRTSELAELYALSQEIGFLYSFPDLLRRLISHLRQAVRCDLAGVCLHLEDRSFFILESRRPLAPEVETVLKRRAQAIIPGPGMEAPPDACDHVQPADYDASLPPLHRLNSLAQAPIYAGQRVVGMIVAGDEQESQLTAEHARLLTTFANQASSAVVRLADVLTEQQQQAESLLEHLPVGVLLVDPEMRILVANPLGRELAQALNPGSSAGEHLLSQLGPYNLADLTQRADPLAPVEITVEQPVRRVFSLQVRPVKLFPTTGGTVAGKAWGFVLSDITREKQDQARIQSQDRLATVGQLAAGIAHDFNNIMATILVYSDLLRFDQSISEASQEKLGVIQAQIQRAASLIRQILDFSRKSVIEHIHLDLLPLVKEMDKLLMRVLPETIQVELAYQPGEYWVEGDPTRLQQALMNLALNSRDAMPTGGRLRIELSTLKTLPARLALTTAAQPGPHQGRWICLSVTDTGAGIPPEILAHLFEPFHTTKPAGQGTGLGLAQVYGIITQHGGVIDVKTRSGETNFGIYLPGIDMQKRNTGPLTAATIIDGSGRTVMVVEDDAATREAIQSLLMTANFQVITAPNGVEALQTYLELRPSVELVISDVVMPEMGGIGLYHALKEINPRVRVLLITGHPLDENNRDLLESGEVRWLQKPFTVSEFSRALAGVLDPISTSSSTTAPSTGLR